MGKVIGYDAKVPRKVTVDLLQNLFQFSSEVAGTKRAYYICSIKVHVLLNPLGHTNPSTKSRHNFSCEINFKHFLLLIHD